MWAGCDILRCRCCFSACVCVKLLQCKILITPVKVDLFCSSCKGHWIWVLGFYLCHACCCHVWISLVYDSNTFAGMALIHWLVTWNIRLRIQVYIQFSNCFLRFHLFLLIILIIYLSPNWLFNGTAVWNRIAI